MSMKRHKKVTIYRVQSGTFRRDYYTRHHAEQMQRALALHGMTAEVILHYLPDDPLTRITVGDPAKVEIAEPEATE